MTMLSAIRLDVSDVQGEVASYQTEVLEVCTYANALYNTVLPTDLQLDWYDEYSLKLRAVRSDVGEWERIYQRLFDVPRQILDTSAAMKDAVNEAMADAQWLKASPGDQLRLTVFRNRLRTMEMVATDFSGSAQLVAGDLDGYTVRLLGHVDVFEEIVARALETAEARKARIDELNREIDGLRDRVRTLGASVAVLSVATAGGVVIGIVGLVLAPFTGGVSLALLIPAAAVIAAGSVGIGLTAHELTKSNEQIAARAGAVTETEAALVQLQQITAQFREFVAQNQRVRESLGRMEARWDALGEVLRTMMGDLDDARPEALPDWDEILDDLRRVQGDWQSVDALAQDLRLVEVRKLTSPESLSVGMTADEVLAVAQREARPFGGVYVAAA